MLGREEESFPESAGVVVVEHFIDQSCHVFVVWDVQKVERGGEQRAAFFGRQGWSAWSPVLACWLVLWSLSVAEFGGVLVDDFGDGRGGGEGSGGRPAFDEEFGEHAQIGEDQWCGSGLTAARCSGGAVRCQQVGQLLLGGEQAGKGLGVEFVAVEGSVAEEAAARSWFPGSALCGVQLGLWVGDKEVEGVSIDRLLVDGLSTVGAEVQEKPAVRQAAEGDRQAPGSFPGAAVVSLDGGAVTGQALRAISRPPPEHPWLFEKRLWLTGFAEVLQPQRRIAACQGRQRHVLDLGYGQPGRAGEPGGVDEPEEHGATGRVAVAAKSGQGGQVSG